MEPLAEESSVLPNARHFTTKQPSISFPRSLDDRPGANNIFNVIEGKPFGANVVVDMFKIDFVLTICDSFTNLDDDFFIVH